MQRWLAFWSSLNVHQSSASFPGELVARRPRLTLGAALVAATGEVELGGCDGGRDQGCKCELSNPALTTDAKLGATFYDSQRVFYNIRDYTGANSWDTCAQNAQAIYRDSYVLRNNGRVPGYWDYG